MSRPTPAGDRAKFEHVPFASALLYGSAGIPLSMTGTTLALYLYIFYTDTVGLDALYISAVMFIGSMWDAVSDQLMGQISDRTRWRWGRRRPYMLLGLPIFCITFYLIVAPPAGLQGAWLFAYLLACRLVLFTGATMIYVPLYSLAPEMAQSYHDRTRLTAWREGFGNLGDWFGMITVPVLALALVPHAAADASAEAAHAARVATAYRTYALVGLLGAIISLVCIVAAYWGSYEDPEFEAHETIDWKAGLIAMRDNRAFRLLILATAFPGMAIQMTAGLFLFLIAHVLGVHDDTFKIAAFSCYVFAAIGSYPLWTKLARRYGKAFGYRAAIVMMATAYMGVYILDTGTLWRLFPIMGLAGAGNAGFWTGMFSQLADIADFDDLETGNRREGLFAGFAALVRKIGYAIGGGAIGVGLTLIGYMEGAPVQSAHTIFGLKLIFSIPTCALALVGLYIFREYPITEDAHAEVRRLLDERRDRRVTGMTPEAAAAD